jgi:hypothetical protein
VRGDHHRPHVLAEKPVLLLLLQLAQLLFEHLSPWSSASQSI